MKSGYIICLLILGFLFSFSLETQGKSIIEEEWFKVIEEATNILKDTPEDVETRFKLAVAYANIGEIEKTLTEFQSIQKYYTVKDTKNFIEKYQKIYSSDPTNLIVLNYLAFAYYISYQHNLSKTFFQKIIALDPKNIMAYNYLALVYGTLNELDQAIDCLKQARKIKDNKLSHLVLGLIYYKKNEMFKAMWHISRSGSLGVKLLKN